MKIKAKKLLEKRKLNSPGIRLRAVLLIMLQKYVGVYTGTLLEGKHMYLLFFSNKATTITCVSFQKFRCVNPDYYVISGEIFCELIKVKQLYMEGKDQENKYEVHSKQN